MLLVLIAIGVMSGLVIVIWARYFGLYGSRSSMLGEMQDRYWEYISGEAGRDDDRSL